MLVQKSSLLFMVGILFAVSSFAETTLFKEEFGEKLSEGWEWVRENPKGWRLKDGALEILVETGNMWGPENSGKNVLRRALPEIPPEGLSIECEVENDPTNQYEQIDLVCYYDDANMVKIGLELVDKQLSLVMGREEKDWTRTLAIVPVESKKLKLRLAIKGTKVTGYFKELPAGEWRTAGECALPGDGAPDISIQAYRGAPNTVHWARVSGFQIEKLVEE